MTGLLARTIQRLGFDTRESVNLAEAARRRYVDPSSFRVFEDTRPTLERLANSGWRNIVLSNHVPELAAIVSGIGLDDLIDTLFTSALTGYEKPHPEAFAIARREAGDPTRIWMVGDNPDADVLGAQAVGIPAILVRQEDDRVARQALDLLSVVRLIEEPIAGEDYHRPAV